MTESESNRSTITTSVLDAVKTIIKQKDGNISLDSIDSNKSLTNDIGFDSLDIAQLSALLEDNLGSDPYSEGQILLTIGEIIEFYDK